MKISTLVPLAAPLLLIACGEKIDPTFDLSDVEEIRDDIDDANDLPITVEADLPSGTASYSGGFYSPTEINDADGFAIVGNMDMRLSFDGDQRVSGAMSDINLLRDGDPDQLLDGALTIRGDTDGNRVVAEATGELEGAGESIFVGGRTDVDFTLVGEAREDVAPGDTIVGSVTGSSEGLWRMDLDGSGQFYVTD